MREIDIIEGVNQQFVNTMALHTSARCIVENTTIFPRIQGNTNVPTCVASAGNLPGGSVLPTYGTNFNLTDGGVYAMEWTTESISIWFFPHIRAIPNDVTSNTPNPSDCDFQARFKGLKIAINTTFWAGKVWQLGGCAASTGSAICEAYIR